MKLKDLKNKIINFFKPKPKTFLLGDGKTLNINGTIPSKPIYSFFNSLGANLLDFTNTLRKHITYSKINNKPFEYSTSLTPATTQKSHTKSTGLLPSRPPLLNNIPPIIPTPILNTSTNIRTLSLANIHPHTHYTSSPSISLKTTNITTLIQRHNLASSKLTRLY